ncbi:MAG: hypothetical protein KIT79_02600 [Deltaproteobacteria bacterium]|nr:hypothetical protein [Deltaproteobacteria bacterium]
MKGLLGADSAVKIPEIEQQRRPGQSIPPGLLPFDGRRALAYLDNLISFQLDFRISNERIHPQDRVAVEILSRLRKAAADDFEFDSVITQTPLDTGTPSRASMKFIRTGEGLFMKLADAPWWRYPPDDRIRVERYLDTQLLEEVLVSLGLAGQFRESKDTYLERRVTRYRVERKPGELPPHMAALNPASLELGAQIMIDDTTGMMLGFDFLMNARFATNPEGTTVETLSMKLDVRDIGNISEIQSPASYVEGPKFGTPEGRPR